MLNQIMITGMSFLSVFKKDIKSELRTRYSVSALLLFILTTITVLMIAVKSEAISTGISAGLLWIIMFFSAMTGLSKAFVEEEERGTVLFLKLTKDSTSIYFGKLLYNIVLNLFFTTFSVILFILFFSSIEIKSTEIFIIVLVIGNIGISACSTIISAIISRANTKGALFPVLSFPMILPILLLGIDLTTQSFEGTDFASVQNSIQLLLAYCGIVITASFFLFDSIWQD